MHQPLPAIHVGDIVRFGRENGQKTLGRVTKCNPSRARVQTLEERGTNRVRGPGRMWNVAYSLLEKVDPNTPEVVALLAPRGTPTPAPIPPVAPRPPAVSETAPFSERNIVMFGSRQGSKVLGVIVRVNNVNLKVKQLGFGNNHPPGTVWTVSPNLCRHLTAAENDALTAEVLERVEAACL